MMGGGLWVGLLNTFARFKYIQTDFGTTPTATTPTDTLTFTSSDNTMEITGDSASKTVDFKVLSIGANLTEKSERPTGTRDGSNRIFTLSQTPQNIANTMKLFVNGVYYDYGTLAAGGYYTVSGTTLTMEVGYAPTSSQVISVIYFY